VSDGGGLTVHLDDLRLEGESLAFTWWLEPAVHAMGSVFLQVVDSLGALVHQDTLAQEAEPGASQGTYVSLPVSQLDDGDYVAWVTLMVATADQDAQVVEGLAITVARGRAYPSTETVAQPDEWSGGFEVTDGRIEDRWFRANVSNPGQHPITLVYEIRLGNEATGSVDDASGDEYVSAGATQQINYLLPDELVDGSYFVSTSVRPAGTDTSHGRAAWVRFRVTDNQVTPEPD
jgi:hypothetical protein